MFYANIFIDVQDRFLCLEGAINCIGKLPKVNVKYTLLKYVHVSSKKKKVCACKISEGSCYMYFTN